MEQLLLPGVLAKSAPPKPLTSQFSFAPSQALAFSGCRPLSDEEMERVIWIARRARNPRNLALLTVMLRCGLRVTQTASIRWRDLYLSPSNQTSYLHLPRHTGKGKRKGFTMPLHVDAVAAIRALFDYEAAKYAAPGQADYVFHGAAGANSRLSRKAAWEAVKRIYRKAGISGPGCALHSIRKQFAMDLQRRGHDINLTRQALLHAKAATTQAYLGMDALRLGELILGA